MGDGNPTSKFDTEALTALSTRLAAYADRTLVNKDAERDLRLASQVCDRLCYLRFEISRIAQAVIDNPQWSPSVDARDLVAVLERVEQGNSEGGA
jgi:hypothetical protein